MHPSLAAANEINTLWRSCVGSNTLADCPSDEEVAVIIARHYASLLEKPNEK
jgi:hypothetical protein